MKYLLILVLIGLAALEFFHQLSNNHALEALTCAEPRALQQEQRAGERLRQHPHSHR
jgi:hypothetical protein